MDKQLKGRLKSFVRVLIAIAVLIGLSVAVHRAIQSWNEQVEMASNRVGELQHQLDQAQTVSEVQRLTLQRDQAESEIPSWKNLDGGLLFAGGVLYALGLLPAAIVLTEAIRAFGVSVRLLDVFVAQILGHLGKYVPGKAMVVVIRARYLHQQGVPLGVGATAVFIETLLMMAVGAAVSGLMLCFLPVPRWMAVCSILGGALATVPTIPFLFRMVVEKISQFRVGGKSIGGSESSLVCHVGWRLFGVAWFWSALGWLLIGASFTCLVMAIPGSGHDQSLLTIYLASLSSIALAMVIGFVSLLPGGAGVRELVIATVLAPIVGASQALVAAIAARLVFLAVELAGSTVAGWLSKK